MLYPVQNPVLAKLHWRGQSILLGAPIKHLDTGWFHSSGDFCKRGGRNFLKCRCICRSGQLTVDRTCSCVKELLSLCLGEHDGPACQVTVWVIIYSVGHLTFWISLSPRPKTETIRVDFGLSPEFRLTNHRGAHHCSLHSVIADISVFLCICMNKRKI